MRYMYLVKSCQSGMPPARLFEELDKLAQRAIKSGAMIDSGGLLPPPREPVHQAAGRLLKVRRIDAAQERAIAELRTAVRLSPRHNAARQELEALSPKDSALTSLRKLFG